MQAAPAYCCTLVRGCCFPLPARPGRSSKRVACRAAAKDNKYQQDQQEHAATATPPVSTPAVFGDADKEESRKFRRVNFDQAAWANHRSTSRYWRHISSMTRSRVVKGLTIPLTYVGIVATMVCCYEAALDQQLLPSWAPVLTVSATGVYSLSTFALSLLLVFRTNSSYHRWNDARKLWGSTTNRCRDLARQVLQWMTDPSDAELAAGCCRLIRAFPIALMASLRNDHDLKRDLEAVLQPQELQLVMAQPHTGTAILQALGALVAASRIKELQKLRIDENITVLQDAMGGCERIFRTPIPLVYTRHTSRFLIAWLTILPFCTAGQVGWLTVPIACAMAFFLLGIEEIGVQVEEPFGILALELFCENISRNVQQAQGAAAAMQAVAQTHAHAIQQHPQGVALASTTSSSDGGRSSSSGNSSSLVAASKAGSKGDKPNPVPLIPPQVLVAGQSVPAAEQAYSTPVSLPAPATQDLGSSGSVSSGGRGRVRQRGSASGWSLKAMTSRRPGSSMARLVSEASMDPLTAPESLSSESEDEETSCNNI